MATKTVKQTGDTTVAGGGELGRTGLNSWGGQVREEFLRELQGIKGIRVYREMRDNDAVVGAILTAIELLIRNVTWRVEAADDSQEAVRAKDLVETSLNRMSFTWKDTLSEILSMLVYGWSWLETVYEKREDDGLLGWKKWAIRGQETLIKWEFDPEGGIQGMWQSTSTRPAPVLIPIDRSLLFRTRIERNNPEGYSILRRAYRSWFYKKRIEEIEGIAIERDMTGVPVLIPPEGVDLWNTKDSVAVTSLANAEKVVRSLKRDQHEGIVIGFGWELKLLTTGGRRQMDITGVIERYDRRIAMSTLADFILMGSERVGSFALARTKSDIFVLAVGAYLEGITEVINTFAIRRLMDLNSIPKELSPKLVPGTIEHVDLVELGGYITSLAGAGAPLFPDPELEKYLRRVANLPQPPEEQEAAPASIVTEKRVEVDL